jgi:hypothetical protein
MWTWAEIRPQCLDANPSDRSARADVLLREEPEEDEEDHDEEEDEDEGKDEDDEGYAAVARLLPT